MGLVVPPLLVATIPVGALVSAAFDSSLRHRSRFGLRLTGFLVGAALPQLLVLLGAAVGIVGEEPEALLIGLVWSLVVLVLAPVLLFKGPGGGRGPTDDGDEGHGPADDPPSPTPPIGGLPLPDAAQSALRLRGPGRLGRGRDALRRTREPERAPVRLAQPR